MKNKKVIIISAISIIICAVVATITITMLSKKVEYEVYFDVAGGSKIQAQQVEKNQQVIEPKEPVKVGFEFKGWYVGEEKFDFTKPITQNITLTAKWEADGTTTIYTVEFDSVGGTMVEPIQISEGQAVTEPKAPTKENFVFDGWYFGESKFDFSITIMQNIKLTAKWTEATSEENLQVGSNPSTNGNQNNNNANHNNQNNQSSNESVTHNIAGEYAKLSGIWYLNGYENVYLEISASIGNNNINYVVSWNNINLLGDWQLFTSGGANSIYLVEFLNQFKPNISNSQLQISSGNKQLSFSRQKTIFNTSKYDNFIGKWFLPGFGEQCYVEITKEAEKVFRIRCNNFNINTVTKQEGCYTQSAEEIYEMAVYNKNTIFDKNNITLENGVLYIGNGAGKKEFSKTPSTTIHKVTGVRLENSELRMNVGSSKQFTAIIEPANATNKAVTWSSSNTSIATVDDNGVVKTGGLGEVTITVRTVDGNHEYHCFLTVLPIPVEGMSLSLNNIDMNVGDTKEISVFITPTYAELNTNVLWESSNPNVAIVEAYGSGIIVAKGEGQAILTARAGDKSATCTVNVSKINVQKVTLNHTSLDLGYRRSIELTATISPENATNKKIIWTSSDSNIVEVNDKGKLYGARVGTATITAKSEDGVEAICVVNVVYEPIVINATMETITKKDENGIEQKGIEVKIQSITGGSWDYGGQWGSVNIAIYKDDMFVAGVFETAKSLRHFDNEGGTFKVEISVTDNWTGHTGEWIREYTY